MIANVTVQTQTVPANGQITINGGASKLAFFSNTGTFQFSVNGGAFQTGLSILIIDFAAGVIVSGQTGHNVTTPIANIISAQFNSIIIKDTSGSANTITYYLGDGAVEYINPNTTNFIKDAPTYTRGNGGAGGNADLSLADGAAAVYSGVDGATGKTRRAFILQNTDAANTLYLLDANGNRMATLKAGTPPYQILASASVSVQNVAGSGATAYNILETFYS